MSCPTNEVPKSTCEVPRAAPEDLFNPLGLKLLDQDFIAYVHQRSPSTVLLLQQARQQLLLGKDYSDFIIEMAPLLEAFIIDEFGISADASDLLKRHHHDILR